MKNSHSLGQFILLGLLVLLSACSSKDVKKIRHKKLPPVNIKREKLNFGATAPKKKNAFVDRTDHYGLKGVSGSQLYAVDFDSDGDTDLVTIDSYFDKPKFFNFDSKTNKFSKLPYSPFNKEIVKGGYLSFIDLDKDGVLDLLVGTLNQKTELTQYPLRLFKGKISKGKLSYTEQKSLFPKILPSSSTVFLDYDLDGQLDAFVANWYDYNKRVPTPLPDRLLKGKKFAFKDASYLLEKEHEYLKSVESFVNAGPSFGASICDVDLNGFPDIIVAASSGYPNRLWLNLSDKKHNDRIFKDYGKSSGMGRDEEGLFDPKGGGNTFYGICSDYNNDGIVDLALGEIFHSYDPESRDRSSILSGSTFDFPPKFIRTEYHMDDGTGSWSQGDRRASWFDFNNDGLEDLVVDNSGFPPKSRLVLFEQGVDHAYKDSADELGVNVLNPAGTVVLDVNRDGKMDLLVGQTNLRDARIKPRLYLFENRLDLKERRSFRFHLRGRKSNRAGIGAVVSLVFENSTVKKQVSYSQGALPSQNEEGIHFGFEPHQKVKYVEVRWPIADKYGKPKVIKYSLLNFKNKKYANLTLDENGRLY